MRQISLIEERLLDISRHIKEKQRATVKELSDEYGVTVVTIRSDLEKLEKRGQVKRVYGGAMSNVYLSHEGNFNTRRTENSEFKSRIAKAAAGMIKDGTNIIIDAGTTTLEIAKLIGHKRNLHVVTNALPIANELAENPNIEITVIGGNLSSVNLCMVGPSSIYALENIRVNQVFIGAWGIDLEAGFTCSDPFEAEMRRKAIACSQQTIVVADHSKFGRVSLFSFAEIDEIDTLISDDDVGLKTKQIFREKGVNAVFA
jgi:DeoR family fructose operon transcriptional repressor